MLTAPRGAARRRRNRRLRAFLKHERMTVAMNLATFQHHSFMKSAVVDVGVQVGSPLAPVIEYMSSAPVIEYLAPAPAVSYPSSGLVDPLFSLTDRVQRHTVEQRIEHTPYVQILDAPVPLKMEQLVDFFKDFDVEVPAQVIEVPEISLDIIPQCSVDLVPQSVEQLVEVPTVLTPTRIALPIAEQIVNTPVPRGRGKRRVQGFFPVQSSTATPSVERFSTQTVGQIVDIPSGVGLRQGSSSSACPAEEDFTWGLSHFSSWKKSAECRAGQCGPAPARQLMDSGGLWAALRRSIVAEEGRVS